MWEVTNYTFDTRMFGHPDIIVKVANEDPETIIESVGLYVCPMRVKHAIPFQNPEDVKHETSDSLCTSQHSEIYLVVKIKPNKDNNVVYNVLKKMNDDYIQKNKDISDEIFLIEQCPLLNNLQIDPEEAYGGLYTRGSMIYSHYPNIKTAFETLAQEGLINSEVFMNVYEDFAKKIASCV